MGGRKGRSCTFNNEAWAFQKLASEEAEKKYLVFIIYFYIVNISRQ